VISGFKSASLRVLRALDRAFNRLYGWKYNPMYQTGTIAVLMLVILLITGIYLLLFYRIGSPWESVAVVTGQRWSGRWIRTLHRYASDAAVVAIVIHALRMFAQGRSWGPRTLAWISGVVLTGVFFLCGWTGYIMVWDVQGQMMAVEGAKFLDVLPIFAEPISRTFTSGEPLPGAFFFMNLFLHIILPIGVGIVLWLHVSRIARPALMPPRGLTWAATGLLLAFSVLWPIGMAEQASATRLPGTVPLDVFYGFWVPVSRALPAWAGWVIVTLTTFTVVMVPRWTRPSEARRPPASSVNERHCTECYQCSIDCPYEAISMVPREDGRFDFVARVDPALCVSCGICAGSCKPMGVGPPGRTGRDQLARTREFLQANAPRPDSLVVVACGQSADWVVARGRLEGATDVLPYPVTCAGSVHTSTVELLIRAGVGGVVLATCPPRDCWNREGVQWLDARINDGREAELMKRVDRSRLRVVNAAETGASGLLAAIDEFRREICARGPAVPETDIEIDQECDPVTEDERPQPIGARP
jgi:ferredoxin